MKFYEITYMMEEEACERFSVLAGRYAKIKGWDERETLQYTVTAMAKDDIERKLQFLEEQIISLEKEWEEQQKEESVKGVHISSEEQEKCRKVVKAFDREFDSSEIMVVDAGKYGFVKLMNYEPPFGFRDIATYTDSHGLFLDLWEEWYESQLLRLTAGTLIEELDYKDMFKCLPAEKQKELMEKREYFAGKAEISIG